MRILARNLLRVLVVGVLGLAVVAGPVSAKDSKVTKISFTVSLTSTQRVLHMVGRGGEITYGFNQLDGTAFTPSGNVAVEILGNVEYTKGSGPFFGFVTLKFASLSTLGLHMEGTATLRKDGTTALKAKLRVIGGNAAFTGASGTGSFTGERKAALGSPIQITVTINVRGISN
jgi:hypothetical protein